MLIDLYTATGTKKGSLELPAAMFEVPVNTGLMHLALIRQQSNRRMPIAHVRHRGEVAGSTRKLYQQKHTGNARRGSIRSPLLKGGGKSFGPRNEANFIKNMPRKMRRAALFSCLSMKAKEGCIIGLEGYGDEVKTKSLVALLKNLPVELGRRILIVTAGVQRGLELSARNVANVTTLRAPYLNPEDVLGSRHIIFLADAVKAAEQTFGKRQEQEETKEREEQVEKREPNEKKQPLKKNDVQPSEELQKPKKSTSPKKPKKS